MLLDALLNLWIIVEAHKQQSLVAQCSRIAKHVGTILLSLAFGLAQRIEDLNG